MFIDVLDCTSRASSHEYLVAGEKQVAILNANFFKTLAALYAFENDGMESFNIDISYK
jgi:hypothetical protein